MFINAYKLELEKADGSTVAVSLRVGIRGQKKLAAQFGGEATTATFFAATDDLDRLIAILHEALNYTGNDNTIKSGEDLADLLFMNDMLGMLPKQRLLTNIARHSGIFTEVEADALMKAVERRFEKLIGNEEIEEDEEPEKNA